MKKSRFSLGPWKNQESRDGGHSRSIIGCDDQGDWQIASVNLCMGSESEANANLIAAAPEMLEALTLALCALRAADEIVFHHNGAVSVQVAQARDKAHAAITKARGES